MASKNEPKQHFGFSSAAEVLTLPGIDYLHVRPEVRDHPNNKPSNNCSYPFLRRDVGRKDWRFVLEIPAHRALRLSRLTKKVFGLCVRLDAEI